MDKSSKKRITSIESIGKERYQVTILNGRKTQTYHCHEQTLLSLQIISPREITTNEYNILQQAGTEDELYEKALHFITFQPRSIKEVKDKLARIHATKQQQSRIVARLKDQGLLGDKKFTKEFITQHIDFEMFGPLRVREKLIKKGIHYDIIDIHLKRFTSDIEQSKIKQLLKEYTKYPINKTRKQAKYSIMRKLINKGFHKHIIHIVLESHQYLIDQVIKEDSILQQDVLRLKRKYDITKYNEKQKAIQSLLRKGYSYDKIKDALE